jgi:hypothetical protein
MAVRSLGFGRELPLEAIAKNGILIKGVWSLRGRFRRKIVEKIFMFTFCWYDIFLLFGKCGLNYTN